MSRLRDNLAIALSGAFLLFGAGVASTAEMKVEHDTSVPAHVRSAVVKTFGPHWKEALRVSWCESRWTTTAQNGQYLGLFQMGSSERRIYGHGRTALEQARAAARYFRASGRDWSPWTCKP